MPEWWWVFANPEIRGLDDLKEMLGAA